MFRNRIVIAVLLVFSSCQLFAQNDDSIVIEQQEEEVIILQNFRSKYSHRLALMRRVYPLALSAKVIIEEHQQELEGLTKKSKKKKLGKKTHKRLKDEFGYNIRDLYRSEGRLLIRLIHRETGMTVAEIIEAFEGKTRRKWYNGLAKLGGQDLEKEYEPKGEDYITELIIEEIEAGSISFSLAMKNVDKEVFKEGMKDYRTGRKNMRKNRRRAKRKN